MLDITLTGFLYAIVNFLILVGLLYRYLHKPLLAVLAERTRKIENAIRDAEKSKTDAADARQKYEQKLDAVEDERDALLATARADADSARDKLIGDARADAERQVETLRRDAERQRHDAREEFQLELTQAACDMTAALFKQLSDSSVDERLHTLLVAKLEGVATDESDDGATADWFDTELPVRVVSAGTVPKARRKALTDAITALAGHEVEIHFETDDDLVAGARIEFTAAAVDASVGGILGDIRAGLDPAAAAPDSAKPSRRRKSRKRSPAPKDKTEESSS